MLAVARSYFNCSSLSSVPLENNGASRYSVLYNKYCSVSSDLACELKHFANNSKDVVIPILCLGKSWAK